MRTDEGGRFSRAMTQFLEQQCVIGAAYSIADEHLFARFKAFWFQAPERFDHQALLGQFRVELAERGFHAERGGKRPHWLGLTTRGQDNQGHREENGGEQARPGVEVSKQMVRKIYTPERKEREYKTCLQIQTILHAGRHRLMRSLPAKASGGN
jgi:hypothetical protein